MPNCLRKVNRTNILDFPKLWIKLVLLTGLEPVRYYYFAPDPKSGESTNFSTRGNGGTSKSWTSFSGFSVRRIHHVCQGSKREKIRIEGWIPDYQQVRQLKRIIQSRSNWLATPIFNERVDWLPPNGYRPQSRKYDLSVSYVTLGWPTEAISTLCFLNCDSLNNSFSEDYLSHYPQSTDYSATTILIFQLQI